MPRFIHTRRDTCLAAVLFALALFVYIRTLCPTLYWGDCGELAAAAAVLGIPHPTGYPVWTMLAKTWSLIVPFGTFLWKLNLLSAVLGALASAFVYGAGRSLALPCPIAWSAAGLFAFSATFWQQCTFAETYSLTACYTAALIFLVLRWRGTGCTPGGLRLLAFACGLSLTNGMINALFLPGIFLFVLTADARLRQWRCAATRREWLTIFGIAVLPLLSYSYLPLRAMAHPAVCWGDPRTPFAFWYHVTGRPYAPLMFHMPPARVWQQFARWATHLQGEYALPVIALAIVGLIVFARRRDPAAFLLAWVMLADITFAVNYDIYNHYIYFLPCYIALALLFGMGVNACWTALNRAVAPEKRPALATIGAACLLMLVPFQAAAHWERADLHRATACYDYGRDILASVPPGGVLIDNGQDTGHAAMLYLQSVEHFRPDVLVVQRQMLAGIYDFHYRRWANLWYWNDLRRQWPSLSTLYAPRPIAPADVWHEDMLRRLIAHAVSAGRPVAVLRPDTSPIGADNDSVVAFSSYLSRHYDAAPIGLVTRLYAQGRRPAPAVLLTQTRQVWDGFSRHTPSGVLYQQDEFLTSIALDYAQASLARARLAYELGDYAAAASSYRAVLQSFRSDEAAAGLDFCRRHGAS